MIRLDRRALFLSASLLAIALSLAFGESTPTPKTTPPREKVSAVPEPSPTPTPILVGSNLIVNGDFEKKRADAASPIGWRLCDGLVFFHEKLEGRGFVIRIDPTVRKEQARERWKEIDELGVNAPPPPKKLPYDDPYATIGGVDGCSYGSDPIPVKKGMPYRLSIDTRGKTEIDLFFTKIFLKGYSKVVKKRNVRQPDGSVKEETVTEERQTYEWFLACRNPLDEWKSFSAWTPTPIPQNVDTVRVFIYAYWPLHDYWFDNVTLFEGKYPEKAPQGGQK